MKKNTKNTFKQCAASFLIFGVVSIITSIVMGCDKGEPQKFSLPPEGGIIGPVTYNQDNTIIQVEVNQEITLDNEWAFITGELLTIISYRSSTVLIKWDIPRTIFSFSSTAILHTLVFIFALLKKFIRQAAVDLVVGIKLFPFKIKFLYKQDFSPSFDMEIFRQPVA